LGVTEDIINPKIKAIGTGSRNNQKIRLANMAKNLQNLLYLAPSIGEKNSWNKGQI